MLDWYGDASLSGSLEDCVLSVFMRLDIDAGRLSEEERLLEGMIFRGNRSVQCLRRSFDGNKKTDAP